MNPLFVIPILVYALVATTLPSQVNGHRRGRVLLLVELVVVAAALVIGKLLASLVEPRASGLWWGQAALYATAYVYVCGRGVSLVRAVFEIPVLQMRRVEDRTTGGVGLARGAAIGVLERAIALTLILHGEYAAVGIIFAGKALVRFKSLEDPETAEYFLIGTMSSLLLATLGGVGVRLVLP